jgi:hypothetical protein
VKGKKYLFTKQFFLLSWATKHSSLWGGIMLYKLLKLKACEPKQQTLKNQKQVF